MKDNELIWIVGIGVVLYFIYKHNKTIDSGGLQYTTNEQGCMTYSDGSSSCPTTRTFGTTPSNICVQPSFYGTPLYAGRECAGTYIDETKMLKKGDSGCDVLLLQQRLNAIEHDKNILPPTGHFDCGTLAKLKSVKGYSQIRLDMFQPDEEIGFNPLQPTLKTNFNYRYMDIDKK
jgi:hypothetical protein